MVHASRAINDVAPDGSHLEVIDEFPAFSYVLGDDHAHVLAQPLVVLAVAVALQLLLAVREPAAGRRLLAGLHPRDLAAAAVLTAAVGFASPGDLPGAAALMLAAAAWSARGRGLSALHATVVCATALAAFGLGVLGPFLVTLLSPAHGLIANALHPTPLFQVLLMFGGLLPGVALLAARGARPTRAGWVNASVLAVLLPALAVLAVIATAGPERGRALARWAATPFTLPALGALQACLLARVASPGGSLARRAASGLAALGLALVMLPEVVYLRDAFVMRMNTVFKLYYPAWLLLGLASAYAIAAAWRDASARLRLARACLRRCGDRRRRLHRRGRLGRDARVRARPADPVGARAPPDRRARGHRLGARARSARRDRAAGGRTRLRRGGGTPRRRHRPADARGLGGPRARVARPRVRTGARRPHRRHRRRCTARPTPTPCARRSTPGASASCWSARWSARASASPRAMTRSSAKRSTSRSRAAPSASTAGGRSTGRS